ncbi:MAG: SUF system NifU family Fe-S cluster assembly protein [Candidatus Omnitrophica bacterium]|nr:SUF system NifU family Fe-S cluster assembly protein [Candidatus Omnitrophota bacterium]
MSELDELYQEIILDHNKNPRNFHKMEDANHMADGYNPLCGDKVTVYLHLDGDVVSDISFDGKGCAISTASASLMTETIKGKTLDEVKTMFESFHDLVTGRKDPMKCEVCVGKLKVLAGVRQFPMRVKCATLCWHTLKAAIESNEDEFVTTE